MKQVFLKAGKAVLDDVPAPLVTDKSILVAVHHSCVSIGTEAESMAVAADPLYKRALKNPEKIRRALHMIQEQGLDQTIQRIRGTLTNGQATGYSAAGVVIAVGRDVAQFKVGDRVACAGAGIANHAEVICVPVNLAAHIPSAVSFQDASTVTLGAIALQGVRRTAPTLGETVVVIGLGILGQLCMQLLKANGCRVLGVDPASDRLAVARACGMDQGIDPGAEDVLAQLAWATDGLGADAVIVTAASKSHEIISQAMHACRKKGRVVLVGDVGLYLNREDFYRKELDFFISTSYGPGRYDPSYEDEGNDYPLGYVRWTENRNMIAYLALLADQKIRLQPMAPLVADLNEAEALYARLGSGSEKPLLAILRYSDASVGAAQTSMSLKLRSAPQTGKIRVAVIGAGDFLRGTHLPNLQKLREKFDVRWVVSRTGSTAKSVALQCGAQFVGTDYQAALNDADVDLCLISTRHDLHAPMALAALQAGKHVFVEKPLALNEEQLAPIENFFSGADSNPPLLMTGFNRRHSPAIKYIRGILAATKGPKMISYRMNAGYLPPDHWVHGPEGGGRNLGEACHIYDLFNSLLGAPQVEAVKVTPISTSTPLHCNDDFIATIKYTDGSVCSLTYTALGDKSYPKEKMEIFVGGLVVAMEDYKEVAVYGSKHRPWSTKVAQKGHFEAFEALGDALSGAGIWPISMQEQLTASRIAFEVERQFKEG